MTSCGLNSLRKQVNLKSILKIDYKVKLITLIFYLLAYIDLLAVTATTNQFSYNIEYTQAPKESETLPVFLQNQLKFKFVIDVDTPTPMECDQPPDSKVAAGSKTKTKTQKSPKQYLFYQSDGYLKEVLIKIFEFPNKLNYVLKVYAPSESKHLAFLNTLLSQYETDCNITLDEKTRTEKTFAQLREQLLKEIDFKSKKHDIPIEDLIEQHANLEFETDLLFMQLSDDEGDNNLQDLT